MNRKIKFKCHRCILFLIILTWIKTLICDQAIFSQLCEISTPSIDGCPLLSQAEFHCWRVRLQVSLNKSVVADDPRGGAFCCPSIELQNLQRDNVAQDDLSTAQSHVSVAGTAVVYSSCWKPQQCQFPFPCDTLQSVEGMQSVGCTWDILAG